MNIDDKISSIKHFDFCSAIENVCSFCPDGEECDGFDPHTCLFSSQLDDFLDALLRADLELQAAVSDAKDFDVFEAY